MAQGGLVSTKSSKGAVTYELRATKLGPYLGSRAGRASAGILEQTQGHRFANAFRRGVDAALEKDAQLLEARLLNDFHKSVDGLYARLAPPKHCPKCNRALLDGGPCISPICRGDVDRYAQVMRMADQGKDVRYRDDDRIAWSHALRLKVAAAERESLEAQARMVGWDPYGDE